MNKTNIITNENAISKIVGSIIVLLIIMPIVATVQLYTMENIEMLDPTDIIILTKTDQDHINKLTVAYVETSELIWDDLTVTCNFGSVDVPSGLVMVGDSILAPKNECEVTVINNKTNNLIGAFTFNGISIDGEDAQIILDLTLDYQWMYQNRPNQMESKLTAAVNIINDPLNNQDYSYNWEIILPDDVTTSPITVSDGGVDDNTWTFASPDCNTVGGLSDSGMTHVVRISVNGDEFDNNGVAELEFCICLLGDINNDAVVDTIDIGIINDFWVNGSAFYFTVRDCDVNCDNIINLADRAIVNLIRTGSFGTNSVSTPCQFRD